MNSKAPLALMEQVVMVLVFALAAALCLRVFVWSDRTFSRSADRDRAVIEAKNAGELIKNMGRSGGGVEEVLTAAADKLGAYSNPGLVGHTTLELYYGSDWTVVTDGEYSYVLRARNAELDGPDTLGSVRVWVTTADPEDTLFELTVAWQVEVSA